jgi:type IV pilus assembly protein PilY1
MLHAFKTGILTTNGMDPTKHQVETFTGIADTDMGKELWGFIPQNSLPYLRCLAVPPPSSCHLYYNDLSPYITTMLENGVSKTVLIGGLRLGGGTVQASSAANYCFNSSGVSNGVTCTKASGCSSPYNSSCSPAYPTNIPADTCSGGGTSSTGFIASSNPAICGSSSCSVACSNSSTCYSSSPCTGLSSYYALDITDPENPKLLWEFSHPFLGYTYSGPAVIHKWNTTTLTDQYYVMFLSGPTGASDGSSVLDVRAFVLTINPANLGLSSVYTQDLGPQEGFGGRLFTNGLSVSNPPYSDFVFFGYSSAPNGVSGAWNGGIGVIDTGSTDPVSALNPANWNWDITTYNQVATLPITAQVAPGQCFNQTYLFAGTGRYFFPQDNYGQSSGLNYLMAIPFVRYCSNGLTTNSKTCYHNSDCTDGQFSSCVTAKPTVTSLNQTTTACSALQSNPNNIANAAWIYDLDPAAADGSFLAERMVTDPTVPVVTSNVSNNIAYFVTAEPTSDPCGYGGQSRVWGLNCATGGAIVDQSCGGYAVTNSVGTLYLQTSTGAIYKIDNSTSFTAEGNRATGFVTGMPPENAPPSVQPAANQAVGGRVIQWIER